MEGKVNNFRFIWTGLALLVIAGTILLSGCAKRHPATPLLQPIVWRACPQVTYPVNAVTAKQEGVVHAVLHVDSKGKVTSVDTSGDELFFRETVSALSQCQFPKGTADHVLKTVSFNLSSGVSVEYPFPKEPVDSVGDLSSREEQNQIRNELYNYAGEIKSAIESKFYYDPSFKGRSCTLRINLAPDGLLMGITAESGDVAVCQTALAAAKQAHLPAPPNMAVYDVFKHAPIDFKL